MTRKLVPVVKEGRFKIQDIARSSNVTRWHSVNCLRYPSIAEHSYLVIMYAREILYQINPKATNYERLLLLEYCAFHDIAEVLTGDMATPVKRKLESFFPDGASPLDELEEALCSDYKMLKAAIKGTYLAAVAKLADVLEACKFIDVEGKRNTSNHEANMQMLNIVNQMANCMGSSEQDENINQLKAMIEKAQEKEKNDTIYLIRSERIANYKKRIEDASVAYPEFNWNVCHDVMEDLLNGPCAQIDFIDQ